MCRCLEVSRSSYYDWCQSTPSQRTKEDEVISAQIRSIFISSRHSYGARRLKRALLNKGFIVSRRRISRLMKKLELSYQSKRKFRITTDSKHLLPTADNLLSRQFTIHQPDKCYVGDITYIYTQEGWLYLAVVIDLFSRKVVGWCIDKHMKAELVNKALLMALWKRKPARGLLWHTDRGSQYCSDSHLQILEEHGIKQSMSRKGNCWDNAVSESFFGTLKSELINQHVFTSREEASMKIFEYIEVFYNRKRMHSANDYMSPDDYEAQYGIN